MKILRVITSMDPSMGGPCQGIRSSIPELNKIGVENEVLCLDNPSALFLKSDSITIHALGPVIKPWAYTPLLLPWLMGNINRFDVIIVHGMWEYHNFAVYKAVMTFRRANKYKLLKLYIMPHGMLDPYSLNKGNRFKVFRKILYWNLIEARIINNADGILFTCEEELRLANKTYQSYRPKRELNIGYGIESPPVATRRMSESFLKKCPKLEGEKYLLFLGRIHGKKGVDLLVKAYLKLAEERKSVLPKLVIAGPGIETAFGKKIKRLLKSHPTISENIFFPGMLSGEEKWGAFYGCEAFVLPSHQENFGIAVVEALACGKPVLITYQVNIWRKIINLGGGMVAEDTLSGITGLLESWISMEDSKKLNMKESARYNYVDEFSIKTYATKFKEAISDLKLAHA